ncbi:unnamed protein product [Caenorhabditis brenneri]
MPGQKFVHIQLDAGHWTCRVNESCNYNRPLKDVVDLVKHIRWHLKDAHQGRKLVKFHYSFFIQQLGEKINLTDQEVATWQNDGCPMEIFDYIHNKRSSRILCQQEDADLKTMVLKIKREKTEVGLRQKMLVVEKFFGSHSNHLIEAFVSILEKMKNLDTSDEDMTIDSYCSYVTDRQMEFKSDPMDYFMINFFFSCWISELFTLESFKHNFGSTISDIFSRDNDDIKIRLRRLFVSMNRAMNGNEKPEIINWIQENIAKRETAE